MTTRRPRKTPARKAESVRETAASGAEELELEPFLDDDDDEEAASVEVTYELPDDEEFDVRLTVTVPDMEKSAIVAAVEGPLRAAIKPLESGLRWKKVAVTFVGDAMIPSAIKPRVADLLKGAKPHKVTIQRGYPNEVVLEAEPPTVVLTMNNTAGDESRFRVEVESGELATTDLAEPMKLELAKLVPHAAGKAFDFFFTAAQPDDATSELIRDGLVTAGASQITVAVANGGNKNVIYDRELEARVRLRDVSRPDCDIEIEVTPTETAAGTIRAFDAVLPRCEDRLRDKNVLVRFSGRSPLDKEIEGLAATCGDIAPRSLRLDRGPAGTDLLWPPTYKLEKNKKETAIRVTSSGRERGDIVAALGRPNPEVDKAVHGQQVTIDLPAGFAVDAALEQAIDKLLAAGKPASVAYAFAGKNREPVLPPPLAFRTEQGPSGSTRVCDLDTEAGKPAELARAIERRIEGAKADLAHQRVLVNVQGSGPFSRTMRRTLDEALQKAGAAHVQLADHGTVDILLPRLLSVTKLANGEVRATVTPAGRDASQIGSSAKRELDGGHAEILAAATVRLTGSDDQQIIDAIASKGASRIRLDGPKPVQVWPTLFAPPVEDGEHLTLTAAPEDLAAGDLDGMIHRELPAFLAGQKNWAGRQMTLVWPGADSVEAGPAAKAIELLLAEPPETLFLDDGDGIPMQLHPAAKPDAAPEPEPELPEPELPEPELAEPGLAEPELPMLEEVPDTPPQITVLGRKNSGDSPLLMLGIDWRSGSDGVPAITGQLDQMRSEIDGRRVLIVFRESDKEVGGQKSQPMYSAVVQAVTASAAATLVFNPTGIAGPHFEVVHSNLDGLAVGARVRDPRKK